MTDRANRILQSLLLLTLWGWTPTDAQAQAVATPQAETAVQDAAKDNEELARLYKEDQDDRKPPEGKSIDWSVVGPRDKARLARVKEMYAADLLQTGADYYHAAMVLQHAEVPEDFLLAHELCVVAITKGEERGKWLAAASQDRFLMNIGRPQRFGTQFRSEKPGGPMSLYQVDPTVTDTLRRAMDVPPLAKAKEMADMINRRLNLVPQEKTETKEEPAKQAPPR